MMQPAARRFCVVKQHNVRRMRVCRLLLRAVQPLPMPLRPILLLPPPLLLLARPLPMRVLADRVKTRLGVGTWALVHLLPLRHPPLCETL
jgi:hypothetical protein